MQDQDVGGVGLLVSCPPCARFCKQITAFSQAQEEADRATGILDGAKKTAEDYWKDLSGRRYIHAAEFTNGVASDLITLHKSILKKESARLFDEAKVAEARYLSSPGGSAEAKLKRGAASSQDDGRV